MLTAQLCSLERRTARGGRDSIDHPPRARDDVANAVAGALTVALASRGRSLHNISAAFGEVNTDLARIVGHDLQGERVTSFRLDESEW